MNPVLGVVLVLPFLMGATAVPTPTQEVAFTFADPEIVESSGLAVVDDLVVTVNDSGDSARVFVVDPTDGYTAGVSYWNGEPDDIEALAPAIEPGSVWVGDIGDNLAARASVEVLRVPVGPGDRTVEAERYELVYPDGPRDAETLLVDPSTGRLMVVSKGVLGGTVYAAPETLDPEAPNELTRVGDVLGLATDGAFFPDGRHLIIRDYGRAVVYSMPDLEPVGDVPLPPQEQGEGLAVDGQGRIFASTEGQGTDVLRVRLPTEVREAMGGPEPVTTANGEPFPEIRSRAGRELPEAVSNGDRPVWPWFLTGWLGVAVLVLILRATYRRP